VNSDGGANKEGFLKAEIGPELYEAFSTAAAARGMTRTAFVRRAIVLLLDELCEPVPEITRRQVANPADGRRRLIRGQTHG
jgi:hypothetical protein